MKKQRNVKSGEGRLRERERERERETLSLSLPTSMHVSLHSWPNPFVSHTEQRKALPVSSLLSIPNLHLHLHPLSLSHTLTVYVRLLLPWRSSMRCWSERDSCAIALAKARWSRITWSTSSAPSITASRISKLPYAPLRSASLFLFHFIIHMYVCMYVCMYAVCMHVCMVMQTICLNGNSGIKSLHMQLEIPTRRKPVVPQTRNRSQTQICIYACAMNLCLHVYIEEFDFPRSCTERHQGFRLLHYVLNACEGDLRSL